MINRKLAMTDPQKLFGHPSKVVRCSELTRDEKIKILHLWAYDALELLVAEEENMQGPDSNPLLDEILKALHKLGAKIHLENPTSTKQGDV